MKYYGHIIGIDPDTAKSGVAHLRRSDRHLELFTLTFFELYDYLAAVKEQWHTDMLVLVEGGWLVEKSNYHGAYGSRGQRVAKNVGSNHETGRKIVEMCQHLEIDYQIVKPLAKIWRGKDRKITHDEFVYFTGYKGRTGQEVRDAGLLCWNYAGLPIKAMHTK